MKDSGAIMCFTAIKYETMFCAHCGKKWIMRKSGHSHFPFCEECRAIIIQKHMKTTETILGSDFCKPNTRLSQAKAKKD
jgi:hypothetical protein